jgi:hypothetical protein
MIKILNDAGRPWVVRLLFAGMKYGLNFKLTHEGKPVMEFYYAKNDEFEPYGQFVSSYYLDTLLEGYQSGRTSGGICLDGGVPQWNLGGESLGKALEWAKKAVAEREANPPIDKRWLSQYVGDIQRAFEAGDHIEVGNLLFDGEFNDKIYCAP